MISFLEKKVQKERKKLEEKLGIHVENEGEAIAFASDLDSNSIETNHYRRGTVYRPSTHVLRFRKSDFTGNRITRSPREMISQLHRVVLKK